MVPKSWLLAGHVSHGDTGSAVIVKNDGARSIVTALAKAPSTEAATDKKPIFLGINKNEKALVMNPVNREISALNALPVDAFAMYAYPDPDGSKHWYVHDGDANGNDELNCGTSASSVMIIRNTGTSAELLKLICPGRGHHVVTFTAPSATAPNTPCRAFVSNLADGTISVVGNDPAHSATYLNIIATINLHDARKDSAAPDYIPNSAAPHGMVYSAVTGKVYNLNNGYGTIAVINPLTNNIDTTLPLPFSSNLLLSPNGRYALGKGADRSTNSEHVIGKLSVVDLVGGSTTTVLDLPDFYPSTYRFSPDGNKLYVTSAATGKGTQKANVRKNSVLIFDATALPTLSLLKDITVGTADCGRRPIAFLNQHETGLVCVPNPTDGTISIIRSDDDSLLETITIGAASATEFNFSFWQGQLQGC